MVNTNNMNKSEHRRKLKLSIDGVKDRGVYTYKVIVEDYKTGIKSIPVEDSSVKIATNGAIRNLHLLLKASKLIEALPLIPY